MKNRIRKYNLEIDENFFDFINKEALLGTQINKDFFWSNFSKLIYNLICLKIIIIANMKF